MKTTAKHFKVFKKEVEKWSPILGLTDFRLTIVHKDFSGEGIARAWYWIYLEDLVGGVALSYDWGDDEITERRIKRGAFHELLHVKMSTIDKMLTERGYTNKEAETEIHKVIYTLENFFYGEDD